MAQQHSTPTLSKLNSATNVSPLEHESSPKNDNSWASSLLSTRRHVKALRGHTSCGEEVNSAKVDVKPVSSLQRLEQLKMFSRGSSPLQKEGIAKLKRLRLNDTLRELFPDLGQRSFQHHELYDLLTELTAVCSMGAWHLKENTQEVVVFTCFYSVFPGLRFKKQDKTYRCVGFNFNIRLAS